MFKKPPAELKTSAPLRTSDRRKLRQQLAATYALSPEDADALVPDGLQIAKLVTHLGEPGTVYLSPAGDPLWFAVGRGAPDVVPTVYTLWRAPRLLPTLTTPAAVIPVLVGGADLMAPGVVQHAPALAPGQLVCVAQYHPGARGPPLAVGRMAVHGDELRAADVRGKAVLVMHTWRDKLWELGKAREAGVPEPVPEAAPIATAPAVENEAGSEDGGEDAPPPASSPSADADEAAEPPAHAVAPADASDDGEPLATLTPEEVSALLRTALLHAIQTSLAKLPPGAFPLPASTFYTAHLLPARPARAVAAAATPVDIKHAAAKTLGAFLKAAEKDGLLALKQTKGDVLVASVSATHPDVVAHRPHKTVQQAAEQANKAAARADAAAVEAEVGERELSVSEVYKPHQSSVRLFEEHNKDPAGLYSAQDVKALLAAHADAHALVNAGNQAYLNVGADNVLSTVIGDPPAEFLKRDELLARVLARMQRWYELQLPGRPPVRQKGTLKPVHVVVKTRQGRKACTFVSGFEPFGLAADDLADVLQHTCASSTAVTPLPGKNAGLEVMVQGKQLKAVAQLLQERGLPKRYIELEDVGPGKKKK